MTKVLTPIDYSQIRQLHAQTLPLSEVREHSILRITGVVEGCGKNLVRISEMGFNPSSTIFMVKNTGKGPLVLETRGVRVMIGRGLAKKINIELL